MEKNRLKRTFRYKYTSPSKKALITAGKISIGVITSAIVGVGGFYLYVSEIRPLILQYKIDNAPPQKEITNYIPETEQFETIKNPLDQSENYLVLSDETLGALTSLDNKLNDTYHAYNLTTRRVSASFIVINYNSEETPISFKVFCDLEDKSVCFEYSIPENKVTEFKDILRSDELELTNIINGLNKSMKLANLNDNPILNEKIVDENVKYYPTVVQESSETVVDEESNYITNEYYSFNLYHADASKIYTETIKILKSSAESLEGFATSNPNGLISIYKNNKSQFIVNSAEKDINNPSLIILSGQKQKEAEIIDNGDGSTNLKNNSTISGQEIYLNNTNQNIRNYKDPYLKKQNQNIITY